VTLTDFQGAAKTEPASVIDATRPTTNGSATMAPIRLRIS
jgi:hypothetical protein